MAAPGLRPAPFSGYGPRGRATAERRAQRQGSRMPRIGFATILRLVLASFLVGLALAFLDITPHELFALLRRLAGELAADFWSWVSWALSYVLVGAVVVVPLWLLGLLWRMLRRRS